jgi:hypothetical protein
MISIIAFALIPTVGTPPGLEALVAASRHGDAVELDRLARRLGAGRIRQALRSDRPEVRRAAVEAAPHVESSWTLLVPILSPGAFADEATASATLRTARRIASHLTSGASDATEVPRDVVMEAERLLLQRARQPDAPPRERAEALDVVVLLAPLAPPTRAQLTPLVDDPAEVVRAGAAVALAGDRSAVGLLARVIERDAQPQVAARAAAAVCGHLPRSNTGAWTRMQKLALDPHVDAVDGIDLLGCLAQGGTDDRALVAEAARRHPIPAVRSAAAQLARSAATAAAGGVQPHMAPVAPTPAAGASGPPRPAGSK